MQLDVWLRDSILKHFLSEKYPTSGIKMIFIFAHDLLANTVSTYIIWLIILTIHKFCRHHSISGIVQECSDIIVSTPHCGIDSIQRFPLSLRLAQSLTALVEEANSCGREHVVTQKRTIITFINQ